MEIKHIICDYDGVFTNDDYGLVIEEFQKSSGLTKEIISSIIGTHERKFVTNPSSKQFLENQKKDFRFPGDFKAISNLLNQRGESGLYEEFYKFVRWKDEKRRRGLSILSNQLEYRVFHVRSELDEKVGLANFDRIWFSPEVGLQKPFVGVIEDKESSMDVSKVNIFPYVVRQMEYLGYDPEECILIDDSEKNIESAKEEGIEGLVFKNVNQMFEELREKYRVDV